MSDQERLLQVRNIMLDAFGRSYAMYGFPEVVGRIFGLLYFADQPMGLEDIAAELGVSKATVSIHIRFLESIKSVRKVWVKGSRRDYYEAQRDMAKILAEHLENSFLREQEIALEAIERSREVLKQLQQSSDPETLQQVNLYCQYLNGLEQDYEWSLQFFRNFLNSADQRSR